MSAAERDLRYFVGRNEAEARRLERQAQLYGPLTRSLLVEAGVGRGMRLLDVGSGAGDVALLAAELVGPAGSVVGVDVDGAVLEVARRRVAAAGWSNVTFVEGDVRTAALEGQFDAAVGRFVLVWAREPVEVLRACAARVRPGGVVAFQEHDVLGFFAAFPPSALVERWRGWGHRFLEQQGFDPATALRLHATYLAAGLPAPQLRYEAPVGGGPDWPGYEAFADLMRNSEAAIVEAGIASRDELAVDGLADRVRGEVIEHGGVFRCQAAVGIWARVPHG